MWDKKMDQEEEGHLFLWTFLVFVAVFFLVYINSEEETGSAHVYRQESWNEDENLEDLDPFL